MGYERKKKEWLMGIGQGKGLAVSLEISASINMNVYWKEPLYRVAMLLLIVQVTWVQIVFKLFLFLMPCVIVLH